MLFLKCIDPSGQLRILRKNEFPWVIGNDLQDRNQLRDPKLPRWAVQISVKGDTNSKGHPQDYWIQALQPELTIRIGDLHFRAMQIPMDVPISLGDSTLTFCRELSDAISEIQFPKGETIWRTRSTVGINLIRSLKQAAESRLSIYLFGETGSGKDVLASLVHAWSDRASGPFVPINCGGLPMSLVESELFGHVKGSFTGATRDRPGALLQAHGGTLFLDEIGDLPMEVQVKLLRFLECGEIRPVGSDRVLKAEVRLVCATHKPLLKLVKEGKFRQDLYFRLASIPLEVPSLRSRPEDIELLADHFANSFGKALTRECRLQLKLYSWPGNVRELRHSIERAAGLLREGESVLQSSHFDFLGKSLELEDLDQRLESTLQGASTSCSLKEMERWLIIRTLKLANGNRTDTARMLGVARSTLFEMLKRHGIVGPKGTAFWVTNPEGFSSQIAGQIETSMSS